MVDLTTVKGSGRKTQRAVHMDDESWERLRQASAGSGLTMSQVLTRLVWEDLVLPDETVISLAPAKALEVLEVLQAARDTFTKPQPASEEIDID